MLDSQIKDQAIEYARQLVSDQTQSDVSTCRRLREIARRLNVQRIEPNCTVGDGCVSRIHNDAFVIFYKSSNPPARRTYTVAHELGHIVLEKFYPHIGRENQLTRRQSVSSPLEKFVNRIASEIIMPEKLFANLLNAEEKSRTGIRDVKQIIESIQSKLNLSQSAVLFRLTELQCLDTVLVRMFSDTNRLVQYLSEHGQIQLADTWHEEIVEICKSVRNCELSTYGQLNTIIAGRLTVIDCNAWFRKIIPRNSRDKSISTRSARTNILGPNREYWVVGWKWTEKWYQ